MLLRKEIIMVGDTRDVTMQLRTAFQCSPGVLARVSVL